MELSEKMKKLSNLGVRLSIDDFGTGYSSLQYLKNLPVNKVKIDKQFVNGMLTDSSDAAIVKAIISLSRDFGHEVIAEGVETEEQLIFLREQGSFLIQGYHISRPLPAGDLEAFLENKRLKPKLNQM
jgi:EAL domain-containing protein (putative c-di-GMP-specific phosphodiesterase class I)